MFQSRKELIFGTLMGAWLGFVYALASQAINWISLPGIPLKPPQGDDITSYLLSYLAMGALLGLVSSLPHSTLGGVALGGGVSAFIVSLASLVEPSGVDNTIFRAFFLFTYTFLPLAVLLMPAAWVIRLALNAQQPDPDHPELWARRYLIPLVITLGIVVVGTFSLYSADEREAMRIVNTLVVNARNAQSVDALPGSLKNVSGYLAGAQGRYALSYSDDLENFMGPQPVGDQLAVFLVVVEFRETGLRFACVFQGGETVTPYCTNF